MKLGARDFPKVQWSLLGAVATVALGAVIVRFSLDATTAARVERAAQQVERDQYDGKLRRVRSEENEIKHKAAVFNELMERGLIGDEQRLDWVELLKDIRDTRRLIDLQYEFSPQRSLDASGNSSPAEGFAFFASAMKLQVKLLHEEDLTRLLDDLRRRAPALIQVKNCAIARLPNAAGATTQAQLQAECQIDWVTLHEVGARPAGETP